MSLQDARNWWHHELTPEKRRQLLEKHTEDGGWSGPVEERQEKLVEMYEEEGGGS